MAPVRLRLGFATALLVGLHVSTPTAKAQIAFAPTVNSFPNGVTLNATPVVSADRRYVRMTLNPIFNSLEGFDTYGVPLAASGGGGTGAGGLGGLGGGGGGPGGGLRSMTVNAGMDGVIGPGNPFGQGMSPHSAYASAEASSILSGNTGYAYPPGFDNVDENSVPVRRKLPKKPVRKVVPKKRVTAKSR